LVAFYRANSRKHIIADVKVVSPFITSVTQQDAPRAAAVAFANTEEPQHERILGRDAFERGRAGVLNRRANTGSRKAVKADYAGAIRLGHDVIPVIHEVFGGWGRFGVKIFRQLARCHHDKINPALATWACNTWTAYHAQRISVALHSRSAAEIVTNHRHADTGTRAAGQRGVKRARVQPGSRATGAGRM